MSRTLIVALTAAGLASSCKSSSPEPKGPATSPSSPSEASSASGFSRLASSFLEAELEAEPQLGVDLGRHEFDGRLPDMTRAGLSRTAERLKDAEATFAGMDALPPPQEYERQIILNHVRERRFELEVLRLPYRNPMTYPGLLPLADYISRDYAPEAARAQAIVKTCDGAGALFAAARENLESPIPRTWLDTALLQTRGLRTFVREDIPQAFDALSPAEAADLEAGLSRCDAALAGFADYLEAETAKASDDFRLGAESFVQMLAQTEALNVDLARLSEIGEQDLARNLATLDQVAARAGQPVDALVAEVMNDKPPADQVLTVATRQAEKMRAFLIAQDLVTVPGTETAIVKESPPFMRWNSAFLSSAGPFEEKDLPSFYYISPPDPSWSEAVQRDYIPSRHDLLFVTIHEVWPGHFLHRLHQGESESRIAKAFCSYAMAEGWAHYAEEMMLNQGVGANDPATHVGQLQNALLRNVRYLSAIGLHAEDMTLAESKQLFVEKGLQDEGNALQQAVRGTFDPGYLKYTLGKLMIRKLRHDWMQTTGRSLREFHDTFLSYQCAPLPAIRELMLGSRDGVL